MIQPHVTSLKTTNACGIPLEVLLRKFQPIFFFLYKQQASRNGLLSIDANITQFA